VVNTRIIWLALAGVALVATSRGDEFTLKTASGSIRVTTTLTLDANGHSHLTATATNNTGFDLQSARICVSSPSYPKDCLYTLVASVEWPVNKEVQFGPFDSTIRLASAEHSLLLTDIRQAVHSAPPVPRPPSRFASIQRIFVDEFGGNTGPVLREHIIGALANSGRFTAVEKPDTADAIIRGRSDPAEESTQVTSAGKGSAGAVFGTVIAAGKSTSVSKKILEETVSLRLTLPSGEVIWAWDETKPCYSDLVRPVFSTTMKAKCAVQDLKAFADR
jgi:hypothetical protein